MDLNAAQRPGMPSLEEVRACIATQIEPAEAVREPLAHAMGRILREEVIAREEVPAFDRSAMDGFAMGEGEGEFRIVGEARPGKRAEFSVGKGECARIFTGAQIPDGASRILKQEDAEVAGERVRAKVGPSAEFIRRRGEDAHAGQLLLAGGTRLGPAEIALLASLGIVEPMISRECKVAHFGTGDELVDPSEKPEGSQIRDSNSALVRAFAEEHRGAMAVQGRVKDDLGSLTEAVRNATDGGCDLVLISGGASVGAYDFGRAALEACGYRTHFGRMNLRPGKPLIFATRERQAAFVLPGNPLSHLAVLNCVVRVAFERFAGVEPRLAMVSARQKEGIDVGGDGRDTLWPARLEFEDGEAVVAPLRWQNSGDITGIVGLNAFIRCRAAVLDTGAPVACILLHG